MLKIELKENMADNWCVFSNLIIGPVAFIGFGRTAENEQIIRAQSARTNNENWLCIANEPRLRGGALQEMETADRSWTLCAMLMGRNIFLGAP